MRLPPRLALGTAVLAAGAAAVVVSAAGPASARPEKRATTTIEVTWSHPKGDPKYNVLAEVAQKFEKANPGVKVNILFDGGDKSPPITARWRAGNPPEVTDEGSFFDGTEPSTWQWVQAKKVYDLTSIMNQRLPGSKLSWKNSILPFALAPLTYAKTKHVYATPGEVTAVSFYYNKQIFAQHGITPPKTWPQFLAVCAKLKAAGVAPLAVTGTYAPYMGLYFDYLLMREGGYAPAQAAINGTRRFATVPRVQKAAADLNQLVKGGYFIDGFQGIDFTAAQLSFFQGKTAMILMGSWLRGEMVGKIPPGFQLATFPFPTVPGGKGDQNGVYGQVNRWEVAAQSKNPKLGAKFLQFYASPAIDRFRNKQLGNISAYKGAPAPPGLGGIVSSLQHGASFGQLYLATWEKPQAISDAYEVPIQQYFFGQIDAPTMVDTIDKQLAAAYGH
jgi:raffinose/stachyose/melibiose transport system substrate-binding protein